MKSVLKLTWFCIIIISLNSDIYSQNTTEIAGAQYGALSNTGVAHSSVWQNFINPAGILNSSENWQVGISYTNRFGLSELSSRNLVASSPLKNGRIGFIVHSFGYSAFTQNQFSAAYALNLGPKLRGGIQLNYISINIGEGFGRFSALTGNVGFQYDFNDKVSVGLLIKNPNRSKLSSEIQEYVQSVIHGGIKFQLAENLMVLADLRKDIDFEPDFSLGIEYAASEIWFLRGGMSSLNRGISFGFGYQPSKWSLDLASLYHQVLGFSPMVSITYKNE